MYFVSNNFHRLSTFSQNIEFCRESIFSLRYADVTNYIGLSESTMISYDTKGVAPYLTVADIIAKLYCTSIDRLCDFEIVFDKEEALSLQVAFIQRVGGIPIKLYKEKLLKDIALNLSLSTADVYSMLISCFKCMIKELCRFDKFTVIEKDESIISNFTANFRNLRKNCNLSFRKLAPILDISIGNLCRLEKGCEPMLSAVVKIADYFGISVSQLLSPSPNFDYKHIFENVKDKKTLSTSRNPIPDEIIAKDRKYSTELLSPTQAQNLASKWLDCVDC